MSDPVFKEFKGEDESLGPVALYLHDESLLHKIVEFVNTHPRRANPENRYSVTRHASPKNPHGLPWFRLSDLQFKESEDKP